MNKPSGGQISGIAGQEQSQNDETRPPKRLCLPAEPSDQDLLQVLITRLSSLLDCQHAESLIDLCTAVQ